MNILTSFKLGNGMTILECDIFSDDQITENLRLDGIKIDHFSVEPVKACFSAPKTREIVIKDTLPEQQFRNAMFV